MDRPAGGALAVAVQLALSVGCSAGGGGADAGRDAGSPPMTDAAPEGDGGAPACEDGQFRCTGNALERCSGGGWTLAQMCETSCDPTEGCQDPVDLCRVGGLNAPVGCDEEAPADSFAPEVQWRWQRSGGQSGMPALVANLTDDDGNGTIDLCDVPDVIVTVVVPTSVPGDVADGFLHVLDGATGAEQFVAAEQVAQITPAVGDVDGDGLPEIVSVTQAPSYDGRGDVVIFEHDGSVARRGDPASYFSEVGAVALADLDADGDVEILIHNRVFDHEGRLLFQAEGPVGFRGGAIAADLDADGDQEVIVGNAAYDHDGTLRWTNADVPATGLANLAVADLDGDDDPEIVVTHGEGVTLIDHTGVTVGQLTGEAHSPPTVQDFDGDGYPEIASATDGDLVFYDRDLNRLSAATTGGSGTQGAAVGFDFLGDGTAEVAYVDDAAGGLFAADGTLVRELGESSYVAGAYPTVADVDNDGSAEVVFSVAEGGDLFVIVVRDGMDRWTQPRRIWNQYSYHVTNVAEDGTIPQNETPSWQYLNTYRANAQIEMGGVCSPLI